MIDLALLGNVDGTCKSETNLCLVSASQNKVELSNSFTTDWKLHIFDPQRSVTVRDNLEQGEIRIFLSGYIYAHLFLLLQATRMYAYLCTSAIYAGLPTSTTLRKCKVHSGKTPVAEWTIIAG